MERSNPTVSGDSHDSTPLDSTVINNTQFIIQSNNRNEAVNYSYVKVIKTNTHVEVHEAQYPFILDRTNSTNSSGEPKQVDRKRGSEYRYRTAKRTKDKIRRLVQGNFKEGEIKHLVLTFKDTDEFNINDIHECNKKFSRFAQKLRKIDKDYMYIKVAEFQKRGAVHFHVINDLKFIDKDELADIWGHGFIDIRRPNYDVSMYIIKYIMKNAGDPRFKGTRSWSHSRNMETPKIFYKRMANLARADLSKRNLAPNYSYSYKTEYNGAIHVDEYDLNDPLPRTVSKPVQPIK